MATEATGVPYEVIGVNLVVQDKQMACWFASALMVLNWKQSRQPGPVCKMLDDETIQLYKNNHGLTNPQIIPLAKRLGLVPIAPQSPTIGGLVGWLKRYGPLWTNGRKHIVVIAGIRGNARTGYFVKVYDPWPGAGVHWRSLAGWYTGFSPDQNAASSRDTGLDVEAVFLHAP